MPERWEDFQARVFGPRTPEMQQVYDLAALSFTRDLAINDDLGAMLAAARKARGLSQVELSRRTDVGQSEISRIERGLGNPTALTIGRLARALGKRIALVDAEEFSSATAAQSPELASPRQ